MFDPNGPSDAAASPGDPEGMLPARLFELLTDALRSGPGSASWVAAVQEFGAREGSDEYHRLLKARQRLESGKHYRALESSAALSEAVMASVAAADAAGLPQRKPLSIRTVALVGALAAAVVLVAAGLFIEIMMSNTGFSGGGGINLPAAGPVAEAGSRSFDSIVPVGWQTIGSLRVKSEHGLRLAGGLKQVDQFGGLFWDNPLPQSRPFRLNAKVRYMGTASVSPEIFLTDDQTFDDERPAAGNHEFAWAVLDDKPRVRLADQSLAFSGDAILPGQTVTLAVEIKIDGASASVATENAGVRACWSGKHLLDTDKPWRMGLRFVVHGTRHDDCVVVEALRLR